METMTETNVAGEEPVMTEKEATKLWVRHLVEMADIQFAEMTETEKYEMLAEKFV